VVRAGVRLLTDYSPMNTELIGTAPFGANFPSIGVNNRNTQANAHTPLNLSISGASLSEINWKTTGPTIFPTQNVPGFTGLSCTPTAPCSVTRVVNPNFRNAHAAESNLDIERALTSSLALDVAYVGNHGYDEGYLIDLNQPQIGAGWTSAAVSACIASAPTRASAPPVRRPRSGGTTTLPSLRTFHTSAS
jgi:hypothetical protein